MLIHINPLIRILFHFIRKVLIQTEIYRVSESKLVISTHAGFLTLEFIPSLLQGSDSHVSFPPFFKEGPGVVKLMEFY